LQRNVIKGTLAECSSGIVSAWELMGREIASGQGGNLIFKKKEKITILF
jgi:hypothetical protein